MGRESGGALEGEDGVEVGGDGGAQMELRNAHRDGDAGVGWVRLRRGGGDGLGEDLGVGAAEVVGVDGCGVVEGALLDAGEGERQGVGGGGFGDELRGELGDGLGDGGLADDELRLFAALFGEELVAGEEGFAEAEAVGVEAGVELAASGVEEGANVQGGGLMLDSARLARTARREMATSGRLRAWQRPLAALRPTRTPVKEPGPWTTATASSECRAMPACAAREWMAGTRRSAAERPGRVSNGGRAGGVGQGEAAGCATGVDEQNLQNGATS